MRSTINSLRLRLVLLVLLAVVPALGLVVYSATEQRQAGVHDAEARALGLARSISNTQDDLITRARQLLTVVGQVPAVRNLDFEACTALVTDVQQQNAGFTNLWVNRLDGSVACASAPTPPGFSNAQSSWFQLALQTRDFAVGDYQIGRVSGKPVVSMALPVRGNDGEIVATVATSLDLAWLGHSIAQAELPRGAALTVIDRNGTVVARYPDPEPWLGKSSRGFGVTDAALTFGQGTTQARGLDGTTRLYGYTPLGSPATGLFVAVGLPGSTAYAAADATLRRNLEALVIVALLALAAAWFGSEWSILRSVRVVLEATTRLRGGDFTARTGFKPSGGDELHRLGAAFDQMAATLHERDAAVRRSEALYRLLAENIPNGTVVLVDPDLRYMLAAGMGLAGYGKTPEMIVGRTVAEMRSTEAGRATVEELYRTALAGTPAMREVANGPRWQLMHAVPVRDERGAIFAALAISQDITERKHAEERVQALNDVLEQRIVERTAQLVVTNQTLQEEIAERIEATRAAEASVAQQAAVAALGQRALAGETIGSLMEAACAVVATGLGAPLTTLSEIPPGRREMIVRAGTGWCKPIVGRTGKVPQPDAADADGVLPTQAAYTLRMGEPVILADLRTETRFRGAPVLHEHGVVSGLSTAITGKAGPLGILTVHTTAYRPFTQDDVHFMLAVANILAAAMDRGRMEEALRASRDELDAIFRNISEGITVQDLDGNLLYANAAAAHSSGFNSVAEMMACPRADRARRVFVNDERGERFPVDQLPSMRVLAGASEAEALVHARTRTTGEERWVILKAAPLRDEAGKMRSVIMVYHDVTQRHRAEELQRTTENLSRSNVALQEFAYVASHDLQEPLRMVASYTRLLQKRYGGKLDADADEFIRFAVDGAVRMQALIDDLLTYSRVESQAAELQPVDCAGVLQGTLANLRLAIDECGAAIHADALPRILGDRMQIGQLFQNLIGNALKFRAQRRPEVRITVAQRGGEWQIAVADNGIGIPAGQEARIFQVFQRLHTREQYPGTGIGLAICKKIVERHGGRIWVESVQGAGTTFYFTLPNHSSIDADYTVAA